ncbi:hypothetical protein M2390_001816 [Mycetocola sp. BIGb0189]|uniref:hypothetical protein n=1 Tax=Mycetocola sp. BIGb0189 TaxID=2940604 RepID=UPI0021676C0F|nr:hypothetical protein [Mycetocola sp. BIGb0189]MCS4276622.1 hypothetical protein [Mycetocola sp. BIGb0189]
MAISQLKYLTVFTTSTALIIGNAQLSQAPDRVVTNLEESPAALVELVTGSNDLFYIEPGSSSDGVYVPDHANEYASISSGDSVIRFQQPAADDSVVEVSEEGTISYLSEDSSYDMHLQPVISPDPSLLSDGLRSLIEIHDSNAPTEYVYDVDSDVNFTLEAQADGSVLGIESGEVMLVIPAPWAVDSNGAEVPTHYEIRGNNLVQHVDFTSDNAFPIIADPVWFVPLIIAGGRVIGQVAINAATRAAAVRAAAAIAAQTVIRTVAGRITGAAAKRCYAAASITGASTFPVHLQQKGDGSWQVRFTTIGALTTVSSAVAGCLTANIK